MPKPRGETGEKNLIGARLKALRERDHLSQRDLAHKLQLIGMDMDKNVITRIETNKSPRGHLPCHLRLSDRRCRIGLSTFSNLVKY